jgi:hypothetical protein
MSTELLETVERLIRDKAFRTEFLSAPRQYLAEMGVSPGMVEKLVPAVMTAIIAGGVVLNELPPIIESHYGWH